MQNTIVLPFGMLAECVDDCGIDADGIYCAFAAAVDISSLVKNSHDVGVVDAAVVVLRLSWQVTRR